MVGSAISFSSTSQEFELVTACRILIICPIGSNDSPQRKRSDDLLKHVIEPAATALTDYRVEIIRSDTFGEPGRITMQILRELVQSDVVIADLTDTNANVMYEVGIRQASLRPMVLMAEQGQRLPFDLSDLRTIFYKLDLDNVELAKVELIKHLTSALQGDVSSVDKALFSSSAKQGSVSSESNDLLAVLEVCQNILTVSSETKEWVLAVASALQGIQDNKENEAKLRQEQASQEMSMFMLTQLMQNPENAVKALPAIMQIVEMSKASEGNNTVTTGTVGQRKGKKNR